MANDLVIGNQTAPAALAAVTAALLALARFQAGDAPPDAPAANMFWLDTSGGAGLGRLRVRNAANTAWEDMAFGGGTSGIGALRAQTAAGIKFQSSAAQSPTIATLASGGLAAPKFVGDLAGGASKGRRLTAAAAICGKPFDGSQSLPLRVGDLAGLRGDGADVALTPRSFRRLAVERIEAGLDA